MEYIEDKEFYHIQIKRFYTNEPFWNKGQTIIIGEKNNLYTAVFENYGGNPGQEQGDMLGAIQYYQGIIREMVFEKIRKENFEDLPSRQKCLWVIPSEKENIDYWWNRLPLTDNEEHILLKLKLTGKIHKVSENYIQLSYNSFVQNKDLAHKYWSGTSGNSELEDEYLFIGTVTVEDVFDSPSSLTL